MITMTASAAPKIPPNQSTGKKGVIANAANIIAARTIPIIPPDLLFFQSR